MTLAIEIKVPYPKVIQNREPFRFNYRMLSIFHGDEINVVNDVSETEI